MQHYQIAIIGFGKAGKTLAGKLAMQGRKIALIEEDSNMYGGTCINIGCIPSKSLVKSASHAPTSSSWEEKQEYYRQAIAEKKELTKKLRQKNYDKLKSLENLTLYLGTASFINQTTLKIQGSEETQISADQIFINTGAIPFIPPIAGLKESRNALTSKELMDLENLPKNLPLSAGVLSLWNLPLCMQALDQKLASFKREIDFCPKKIGILRKRFLKVCKLKA